jgi:hypothetical protein
MQPSNSVHHETIRLVSLNFRLRNRMAAVLSTRRLLCETLLGAMGASCGWMRKRCEDASHAKSTSCEI